MNRRGDRLVCARHGQFNLPGKEREREARKEQEKNRLFQEKLGSLKSLISEEKEDLKVQQIQNAS